MINGVFECLWCIFCGRKLSEKDVEAHEEDALWDVYEVKCPTCHREYEVRI